MRSFPAIRFRGFVIRRRNFSEADRILTIFTLEKGKIEVLAKGIRRLTSKRAGLLEVFSQIKGLVVEGRSLYTLTEVESLGRLSLLNNLETVSYAYYLCEIIDKLLPEDEPQEEIYLSFAQALEHILQLNNSQQAALIERFAVQTLVTLGYIPESTGRSDPAVVELIERISEKKIITPKFIRKIQKLS